MTQKSINIHLYPSPFANESRIEKQAATIQKAGIFDEIHLVGTKSQDVNSPLASEESTQIKLLGIENKLGASNAYKIFVFIFWYAHILWNYKHNKITCVNAHSLSCLPLAVLIKILKGSTLIYDAHELETETNGLSGVRKYLSKLLERSLITFADHIFVVSNSISHWYENEYTIKKPTVVLNAPRAIEPIKSNYFRDTFSIPDSSFIFLYQGALSEGRGIELLLSAFSHRDNANAVIIFMGYGLLTDDIKAKSATHKNIYFHQAVTPANLLRCTAFADIGISFIEHSCLSYYFCMPNKLFEYAMAGLPVMVSNMKEMSDFVTTHEMGIVVRKMTYQSINHAIDQLCSSDIKTYQTNARKAAYKNSWEEQESKMIAIYQSLNNKVAG
jgi:glycosyltransferase involved in cell wall biosynthesis